MRIALFQILFITHNKNNIITYYQPTEIRNIQWIDIVYRDQRWAKRDRLYTENEQYKNIQTKPDSPMDQQRKIRREERNNFLQTYHSWEYKIEKTISQYHNKKLFRPREYHQEKNKIIIHHSALPQKDLKTEEDIYEHLQYIQKLHSFYRKRWDVWYHFFIWPKGKIYEWRSGWPGVIAAHAEYNNYNSIWINLLWNFEYETPSKAQITSLIKLIAGLSKKYNIDLQKNTIYHKKIKTKPYMADIRKSPIWFHWLVSDTACPWKNLEKLIPNIIEKAQKLITIKDLINKIK